MNMFSALQAALDICSMKFLGRCLNSKRRPRFVRMGPGAKVGFYHSYETERKRARMPKKTSLTRRTALCEYSNWSTGLIYQSCRDCTHTRPHALENERTIFFGCGYIYIHVHTYMYVCICIYVYVYIVACILYVCEYVFVYVFCIMYPVSRHRIAKYKMCNYTLQKPCSRSNLKLSRNFILYLGIV